MTKKQKKLRFRICTAALAFAIFFAVERIFLQEWEVYFTFIPYFAIYLWIGYDILLRAVRNIRSGQIFDENLLMALATIGALVIGFLPNGEAEFHEAVFVMLFYQAGELFQSVAVGKSRRSIRALLAIRPDTAVLLRDGKTVTVSPDALSPGDRILVRPGERVPVDGRILSGVSSLDTAALTGESLPRDVAVGDAVYSGSVNLVSPLTVEVLRIASESTATRILDLVQNATEKKAKSENFISRFARYYTPVILFSALFLAFLPPLFSGHFATAFLPWFTRALTFLVISCPCALVISVPLSFFSGIGAAGRRGILVKGSMYLETLAGVKTAVFDKTGTLTRGVFQISEILPNGISESELLTLAASVEANSTHPLARAITAAVPLPHRVPVEALCEHAGRGLSAMVPGGRVLVGNRAFLAENGIPLPRVERDEETVIHVAREGEYLGAIFLRDTPRDGAAAALSALADMGIDTVMLTGDRASVARRVAEEIGVSRYHAECMPGDKVRLLEEILASAKDGQRVAFVGDGINDAPALARADCGVAMGALGSDAAIEAADVVLMNDDPETLVTAIRLSKRTRRIVGENIGFTLCVKAAVLALGAFGLCPMWLAVFADVGVAFLAILNAMRAGREA